jgi:hypothetical protein
MYAIKQNPDLEQIPDLMGLVERTLYKLTDLVVLSNYKMPAAQGEEEYDMDW